MNRVNTSDIAIDSIEVTPEFEKAFEIIENGDKNVFLTGKAGTGKSTFLNYFTSKTKKKIVKLAPTGVSALNIAGQTIHSFFSFPPRLLTHKDIRLKKHKQSLFKSIEILVIDEISMVRADLFDAIDHSLRKHREDNRPFGGLKLLLIGDLYQLPPVVHGEQMERHFSFNYEGPFFFNSAAYKKDQFTTIELQKIFRQSDNEFIQILNSFRERINISSSIQAVNSRFIPDTFFENDKMILTLSSTNKRASEINHYHLQLLEGKAKKYTAEVNGEFDKSAYPTDQLLKLKIGAQVMMLRNDLDGRWANGTLAMIKELEDDLVVVEIDGIEHEVDMSTWEIINYNLDESNGEISPDVVGSFKHYPMKLAWAITIHKSQGQTFDNVIIDLGRGAFAHGQSYVALSRCRSLDGIYLSKKIKESDIIVDKRVIAFMKN